MTRKQRRLTLIAGAGLVLSFAVGLVAYAMNDQIVFFYAPSEVAQKGVAPGSRIRLGGLVEEGSVKREKDGEVFFSITDTAEAVPVHYKGILPDLFREGQGVVAEGHFDTSGAFAADSVLAKHDENYMPPQVADALKKQGMWQHMGDGTQTQ
ncbi:cytochrome c maturation protein CcmE [Afifella sp. IM 167]|uniref:cytochrome c maturation protein CcmE n=1 Tax=Afifella sp. IM 167 TaxID=2033586 RepID=UPI001CCB25DB|nr:cytochrome c maturation protein CcmE [Afifella sp. IM 167]MBZ8133925.1 cytochrome c maturation protein CcmE [Afifella sp. IM 167]